MKNSEGKAEEEEMNELALLKELRRSGKDMKRIECENKLRRQTTERVVGISIREAETSPRHARWL